MSGAQHDIEAALEVAEQQAKLYRKECIARPHPEMVEWLFRPLPFFPRSNRRKIWNFTGNRLCCHQLSILH